MKAAKLGWGNLNGSSQMPEREKETGPRLTVDYPGFNIVSGINPNSKVAVTASEFADRVMAAGGPEMLVNLPGSSPATLAYKWQPTSRKAPAKDITLAYWSAATLLPLALIVTALAVQPYLRSLLDFSLRHLPLLAVQVLVAVVVIQIGGLLYYMRCRKQMMYGVCECFVGIVTAAYFVNNLKTEDPTPWFSLLAALYIIVRGADNIHKSLKGTTVEMHWNEFFFGKHPLPS